MLDHYESLIEATRLAGREQQAFDLSWYALGHLRNIGWVLGDYQRGYRILAAFSVTGRPEDLAPSLALSLRSILVNELGLFALRLGRLAEAWAIRRVDDEWGAKLPQTEVRTGLRNSGEVAFELGHLPASRALADAAVPQGEAGTRRPREMPTALAWRASFTHALGNITVARTDFGAATEHDESPLVSISGLQYARHHLDLGDMAAARALCDHGIKTAPSKGWHDILPRISALLARIDLMEERDPTTHLAEVRAWTSRTGEMGLIIEAHDLAARRLLALGDLQGALGEAEIGLQHGVACGYGLRRIERSSRCRGFGWRGPTRREPSRPLVRRSTWRPTRSAATRWGEADAAQVWGEAYFANQKLALARRAFRAGARRPTADRTSRRRRHRDVALALPVTRFVRACEGRTGR